MRDSLNRVEHRLAQAERERRRRGIRGVAWPPTFDPSLASDAELEELVALAPAADAGDEAARAKVRSLAAAVNARTERPDAPSTPAVAGLGDQFAAHAEAPRDTPRRWHVHVPPVRDEAAVVEAAPAVPVLPAELPSAAAPQSVSVVPVRRARTKRWYDRDEPGIRGMEF